MRNEGGGRRVGGGEFRAQGLSFDVCESNDKNQSNSTIYTSFFFKLRMGMFFSYLRKKLPFDLSEKKEKVSCNKL